MNFQHNKFILQEDHFVAFQQRPICHTSPERQYFSKVSLHNYYSSDAQGKLDSHFASTIDSDNLNIFEPSPVMGPELFNFSEE
ncbi:MAG: hypothetical protein MHPSP_003738 [Paramarteilia canceri]